MENFADRLIEKIASLDNPSVVGLDPRLERIPACIKDPIVESLGHTAEAAERSIVVFNQAIIDAVADIVPAVKPQWAFYELFGAEGVKAFKETVQYARSRGLLVIGDGKRNDIGSTAAAYAHGHLGWVDLFGSSAPGYDADALTVNPYLGSDGVAPFISACSTHGKGIFVLVRNSNPSAAELQDLVVVGAGGAGPDSDRRSLSSNHGAEVEVPAGRRLYEVVGELVDRWGEGLIGDRGYSSVGAVVGATQPREAAELRRIMPHTLFLVPGYGAQGGGADDAVAAFDGQGRGAIVNSSRGIIFAYEAQGARPEDFASAARQAAIAMRDDLRAALKRAGKRAE